MLSVLALVGGFVEMPPVSRQRPAPSPICCDPRCRPPPDGHAIGLELMLSAIAAVVAILGVGIALYRVPTRPASWRRWSDRRRACAAALLGSRLGLRLALRPARWSGPFALVCPDRPDDVIDSFYNGMAALSRVAYRRLQRTQTGRVRWYAAGLAVGSIFLIAIAGVRMILLWLILVPLVGGVLAGSRARGNADWPRWIVARLCWRSISSWSWRCWAAHDRRRGHCQRDTGSPQFDCAVDSAARHPASSRPRRSEPAADPAHARARHHVGGRFLERDHRARGLLPFQSAAERYAGVIGVFLALDLFLFFFFWELMLVPMYFLIAIWGHERRIYAAIKFFLFTQGSGLLMFARHPGTRLRSTTADRGSSPSTISRWLRHAARPDDAMWLMLGFFVAFAVKLPAVPFHTWLPDAHTEAPTAGSVILAGLLLKTGAYGLLRFAVPLFPDAAATFAPVAMALGVIGILYGALLAFAQNDMKRLVAYTSVSHLGFVLLGIFAWNTLALQGAVDPDAGARPQHRRARSFWSARFRSGIHTRDMRQHGRAVASAPRIGAIGLFFAIASLGLPGLGNFVGEFLVLLGTYRVASGFAIAGTLGLVVSTIYALASSSGSFMASARARHSAGRLLVASHARHGDDDRRPRLAGVLSAAGLRYRQFRPRQLAARRLRTSTRIR